MIACGHERTPFGDPLCIHVRNCRTPWIQSVKWLTGVDIKTEIVCVPCADDRENGQPIDAEPVCEECYEYLTEDMVDIVGCRGTPGIVTHPEVFDNTLKTDALPAQIGAVVDIAPINREGRSVWLLLSIDRWLSDNVWESEDGPTRIDICARDYYWNHAITWIDEKRIVVEGIGNDDSLMIDGVRIFDITLPPDPNSPTLWGIGQARELKAFPGPAGVYFSNGTLLFSSDETGLSRWDIAGGARTGQIPDFRPEYYHRSANELAQLIDGAIVRWTIS